MFIHNSSSKNGRKTIASKLLTHRFSAGCVGEFFRPRAVVLLSSELRVARKRKIMQISGNKGGQIRRVPSFLALAFYRVSKEK